MACDSVLTKDILSYIMREKKSVKGKNQASWKSSLYPATIMVYKYPQYLAELKYGMCYLINS